MSRLKFTIHGFQQQKLIEYGLDNNDALVMAVVRDMYSSISVEHRIIDGDRYIWVNQTALSEYVPIIGVLKTFQRIFKKLTDKGVFESRIVNGRNGKTGKYFYLKPSKLLEDLTEYIVISQGFDQETKSPLIKGQNVGCSKDKKSFDHGTNCPNKDTPTNDSPTSDTKNTSSSTDDRSPYSEKFEQWWSLYPKKVGKGAAWKKWKSEKLEKRFDELIEKLKQQNAMEHAFMNPQYIVGASRYLNEARYDDEVVFKGKRNETNSDSDQRKESTMERARREQREFFANIDGGAAQGAREDLGFHDRELRRPLDS